MSFKTMLLIN